MGEGGQKSLQVGGAGERAPGSDDWVHLQGGMRETGDRLGSHVDCGWCENFAAP